MHSIRLAFHKEALLLSSLAFKAKAYWGYDNNYMELARKDLVITEKDIKDGSVYVLEEKQQIVGFYQLRKNNDIEVELVWLFIDPVWIGKGYGGVLMNHFIRNVKKESYQVIKIKSDLNAVGFYKNFGAEVNGNEESTVDPNIILPILYISL